MAIGTDHDFRKGVSEIQPRTSLSNITIVSAAGMTIFDDKSDDTAIFFESCKNLQKVTVVQSHIDPSWHTQSKA
jgi:hypothetical protein